MTGQYCDVKHLFRQQHIRVGICRSDRSKKKKSTVVIFMRSVRGLALRTLKISGGFQEQSLLLNGTLCCGHRTRRSEEECGGLACVFQSAKTALTFTENADLLKYVFLGRTPPC